MDNLIIPETTPLAIADGAIYTEIAQAVYHLVFNARPTHWRFTVENGLVLARNGDGVDYLVDGPPARAILELPARQAAITEIRALAEVAR
jgi:hypothetical protein